MQNFYSKDDRNGHGDVLYNIEQAGLLSIIVLFYNLHLRVHYSLGPPGPVWVLMQEEAVS